MARNAAEHEQGVRDVTVDGTTYRITRARSPMDVDGTERETRLMRIFTEEARVPLPIGVREEEGNVVDSMEGTGLGTVVVA
jgi:hypothetical protein